MNNFLVQGELLVRVIKTLKELDVRGFDSMDKLVGLVMLFERILNTPVDQAQEPPVMAPNQPPVVAQNEPKEG